MGITAQYYKIKKENSDSFKRMLRLNKKCFYENFDNKEIIEEKIDIDKSWSFFERIFKDLKLEEGESGNLASIAIRGLDFEKDYEPGHLINFSDPDTISKVVTFLKGLEINSRDDLKSKANQTEFTRFGQIDYEDYFDYYHLHFQNLFEFYKKCEEDNSSVLIMIG